MLELDLAGPADAEQILGIYAPYVCHTGVTFEYRVPDVAEFRERMRGIAARYPYLVCREGDTIVGYAYAHAYRERRAFDWCVELSVYVADGAQRKGIGLALYQALLELLRLQGYYLVYAVVVSPNAKSEAFHEKLGFTVSGRFDHAGFKLGRWWDNVYYEKALRPAFDVPAPTVPIGALPLETVREVLRRGASRL